MHASTAASVACVALPQPTEAATLYHERAALLGERLPNEAALPDCSIAPAMIGSAVHAYV